MAETVHPLKKNPSWKGRRGPVVLVIMDGVGYGKYEDGDAVKASRMDYLRKLEAESPHTKLKAHGTAVGLPSDADMGNSEVGHNAMGCGRVFAQGAKLVSNAISSGSMFDGETWKKLVANVKATGGALHFIGLVSDGNVHSHIDHLKAMIEKAHAEGVAKIRVHALLDGRDVDPTSALDYITPLEEFLAGFSGADYCIASGGGRMFMTMDRYNADWAMVEGNPEFTVDFADTDYLFDPDKFALTLTIIAKLYNMDITDDILDADVQWTRYSEDANGNERVASDTAWALKRANEGKSIDLTVADCDFNGYIPKTLKFIATVTLRDGMGNEAGTQSAVFEY